MNYFASKSFFTMKHVLGQANRPSGFAILLNKFQLIEQILHCSNSSFSTILAYFCLANNSVSALLSLSLQNLQRVKENKLKYQY
jgi:predicted Zn-dependent protease